MEASDEERPLIHHLPPQEQYSKYTCDGTVNIDNKPALKQSTGNWRACFFILDVEFTECICFFGVSKNLVTYLTSVLHESNVDAAQSVSIWIGSCFFTPLIGAFLADTYWGRYWTVVMSILVIILDNIGWSVGFASPMLLLGFGLAAFIAGRRVYRYKKLGGSPLTRVFQVLVAAVRNHRLNLPDDSSLLHELAGVTEGDYRTEHTNQFRFFDNAAILSDKNCALATPASPWRLCTVSQVEELKMLLRMFPVWASLLVFFMVTAQMPSTLIEQGVAMDGRVGPFTVPPASLATFDVVAVLVLIPVYDAVLVPLARRVTGKDRGVSHMQRIGVGLALSAVAMAYSALVEARRLAVAAAGTPMSIVWQVPSYFVLGAAEVFAVIGMLEFSYEQSPSSMKSLGTALVQLAIAVANYLNSGMLSVVAAATAPGGAAGWIPDKLDEGHLDYFFWMMAALSVLNLLQFLHFSIRFRGNNTLSSLVMGVLAYIY